MAAMLKIHLIMQVFLWLFKVVDLLITLGAFAYITLQQYFSMADKNDMILSSGSYELCPVGNAMLRSYKKKKNK